MDFANPIGISGGVDKNGQNIKDWWRFGAGFLELGTITPEKQEANPGKIIDRNSKELALWNKMGFPNLGTNVLKKRLTQVSKNRQTPIFVNIGKNRWTPLESAAEDYISCLKTLFPLSDGFVVNISSPNTKGLRQLFEKDFFSNFLSPVLTTHQELNQQHQTNKPLLLKLSPDTTPEQLEFTLDQSAQLGVDGWVIHNTSQQLNSSLGFPSNQGGSSGLPLREKSLKTLKFTLDFLGQNKQDRLVVSVGGISTYDDIKERLDLGCDLIQVYTALIYQGPFFFRKMHREASNRKDS